MAENVLPWVRTELDFVEQLVFGIGKPIDAIDEKINIERVLVRLLLDCLEG